MTCAASWTRSNRTGRFGKSAGTSLDASDALRSSRTTFSSRCRSLSVKASGTANTPTPTAVTSTIQRRMRDLTAGVPSRVGGELEAVPDAAQRGDAAPGRVVTDGLAELPPQRRDVHVEGLRRAEPVLVPDLRHDPLPGDGGARVLHEEGEQVELPGPELDLLAGHPQPAGVPVELDVADREGRRRRRHRGGRAPQVRSDSREELGEPERLGDVVVAAGVEAEHDVDLAVSRGEDHDRHVRVGPTDPAAHLDAVEIGQSEVEQHELGPVADRELERVGTGRRPEDLESLGAQRTGERPPDRGIVLDHEHGCRTHWARGYEGPPE